VARRRKVVVSGPRTRRYNSLVASEPHVILSGDITGAYVVKKKSANGELTLVPDTYPAVTWQDMLKQSGGRDATPEEFAAFEAQHGPFLPADGEGYQVTRSAAHVCVLGRSCAKHTSLPASLTCLPLAALSAEV